MTVSAISLFGAPCASPAMVLSTAPQYRRDMLAVLQKLTPEPYADATMDHHWAGLERFGEGWDFVDLPLLAFAAARMLQPERYLEIGVRRGRSLACVLAASPTTVATGVDRWIRDYAGVANPGPEFVQHELEISAHAVETSPHFIAGNSHEVLKSLEAESFDLITVDGDHTAEGAREDLEDSARLLRPGGMILFDDLQHPEFAFLKRTWTRFCAEHEFEHAGYLASGLGAAIALKSPG